MANIVNSEFSSIYGPYREKKGGNFYFKNGTWEKNPLYVNDLLLEESHQVVLGTNLYDDFLAHPETYNFLK
jgi:glucose-6-phosphate isomerase